MGESYPNVEEYLVSLENIRSVQWDIWGRFWTTKTKKKWILFHIGKHFLSSINNHSCNIILFFHKCPKKYRALHLNVVFEFELHNFTEFIDISQFWGWFDKWCPFSKKSVGLWDWEWWWRCTTPVVSNHHLGISLTKVIRSRSAPKWNRNKANIAY